MELNLKYKSNIDWRCAPTLKPRNAPRFLLQSFLQRLTFPKWTLEKLPTPKKYFRFNR